MIILPKSMRRHIGSYRTFAGEAGGNTLRLCAALAAPIIVASAVIAVLLGQRTMSFAQMLWSCEYSSRQPNCDSYATGYGVGFTILVPVTVLLFGISASLGVAYSLARRVMPNRIDFMMDDATSIVMRAMTCTIIIIIALTVAMVVQSPA